MSIKTISLKELKYLALEALVFFNKMGDPACPSPCQEACKTGYVMGQDHLILAVKEYMEDSK